MLDISILEKYDTQKVHVVYDKWPEIARKSFESDQDSVNFDGINHIVFAGMGGSGAIGDMFASILSKTHIHVNVVKGYLLPKTVDSNTLVVAVSVSGNTDETLFVLDSAHKLGCKIIAFSSGGKMQEYCAKNKIEHRIISQFHSPRASFPTFLFSILRVLEPFLLIKRNDITDSLDELEKQGRKISSSNLGDENPAISLAKWISDIPLIYYPWGLQAGAIRFKNSLQENAKMHAITEDIIEACHNGIVSWERPSTVKPILIQGYDDYIKTKERWKILKGFFEGKEIDYHEIHTVSGSIISKLINLVYLLDYATIYRAVLSNIDPTPIRPIDFVKSKLSS